MFFNATLFFPLINLANLRLKRTNSFVLFGSKNNFLTTCSHLLFNLRATHIRYVIGFVSSLVLLPHFHQKFFQIAGVVTHVEEGTRRSPVPHLRPHFRQTVEFIFCLISHHSMLVFYNSSNFNPFNF